MKKYLSILIILLLALSSVLTICGQTKPEILTNEKILQLIKLGLSENVIVEKIRQSECKCDTSTNGLAKLKAAKVSDAIILAMLSSSPGSYSETPPPSNRGNLENRDEENTVSPTNNKSSGKAESLLRKISEPGIYLFEDGKMNAIEPTIFSGTKSSFLGSAMTYGIKKSKIRAVVRGKSANLQVKSARPEFYFIFSREYKNAGAVMAGGFSGYAATSPAEFMMVAMNTKENSREAILGEFSMMGSATGAPDKYIREYSFEKIEPGIYKVVPKADLAPGEYCFYYAAGTLGLAGGKIFDFSVSNQK